MSCLKKIAVITGSRSEYGLLKPLLEEMEKSVSIKLQLIVTGTHLIREYGYSANLIINDGFKPDAMIPIYEQDKQGGELSTALGKAINDISRACIDLKSDLIIVYGDRIEAFAGAAAGMCLNLPIAHLSGGEVTTSGHIDEQIRHAITKMAHIHFPATGASAERIRKMGEEEWRIHHVGDPGISMMNKIKYPSRAEISQELGFEEDSPIILCVQHPVSNKTEMSGEYMKETLKALLKLQYQTIIIYPNGDNGSESIIGQIESVKDCPFFRIFPNLPREKYLGIMKNCDTMIGNSSSGISEAPSFGIKAVNIGLRERARENAGNIINVDYNQKEIEDAIQLALLNKKDRSNEYVNPFENENASRAITEILENIRIDNRLMIKKMTY